MEYSRTFQYKGEHPLAGGYEITIAATIYEDDGLDYDPDSIEIVDLAFEPKHNPFSVRNFCLFMADIGRYFEQRVGAVTLILDWIAKTEEALKTNPAASQNRF